MAWLGVWLNHLGSSFHFDDVAVIVTNVSLEQLSNIPRFFTSPRTFSMLKESSAYRPLLSVWFALDYDLVAEPLAFIFQLENFIWFLSLLVAIFGLFRLIPGGTWQSGFFGALLFGLHPAIADTVNYPLQRGEIMGAFGVIAGFIVWIVWPRTLPETLPLAFPQIPKDRWEEFVRSYYPELSYFYLLIRNAPLAFYMVPVILALLVEPATAVFAPILLVYILIFEKERGPRRAIPAAVVCGGYWLIQAAFTWRLGDFSRLPLLNYWLTQPWVAIRYLYAFFLPLHLSADTDFQPFAHFWSPLALAGYAGVALLARLAILAGRRKEWLAVSFGIWWFLIALVPDAITPDRVVEADWRMFLPFVGLTLAASRTAWIVFTRVYEWQHRPRTAVLTSLLAMCVLLTYGFGTHERNKVWQSEATLWTDVMQKSPHNGRAFMHYALTRIADGDPDDALTYLQRAEMLSPHDAVIEINLARGYDTLSRPREATNYFLRAIADAPSYSPAYSAYSQSLDSQERLPEALAMATKAIRIDSWDLAGRHTAMDVMAQLHEWADLKRMAGETLDLYPGDPDSARSALVAQIGVDQVGRNEKLARTDPSVDHYLRLSVSYFEAKRYQDCILAAQQALKINPQLAEAYSNLAAAYNTLGRVDEAIAALQEEVRLNANLRGAKSNLQYELNRKAQSGKQEPGKQMPEKQ